MAAPRFVQFYFDISPEYESGCRFHPERFWNALADRDVFVIPGSTMDVPGHFRICLTASKEMVERSLPVFTEVAELMQKERKPAT